jgi:ribosomal-protein-alanine N-acetyltransferase
MYYETDRLIVREVREEDAFTLHAYRSSEEIARYMDFTPESLDDTQHWVRQLIRHNHEEPRFAHHAVLCLKPSNAVIGWIGLGHPDTAEGAIADRDFGYALGKPYWGRGLGTEAVRGLLQFCFNELGVNRVAAQCAAANRASSRVLEKADMERVRTFTDPKTGAPALLFLAQAADWNRTREGTR